jgi:predicted GIY-YIG superfamily endonuclease
MPPLRLGQRNARVDPGNSTCFRSVMLLRSTCFDSISDAIATERQIKDRAREKMEAQIAWRNDLLPDCPGKG